MLDEPLVSVIIPVYNRVELLDRCLLSLSRQVSVRLETLVVDDGSPEDPGPAVARYPDVRLIRAPQNGGYAAANNQGLLAAAGEYLLFLNSDTELAPGTLARMTAYLEAHPEAGGVAPAHREPGGALQRTCFRFPTLRLGFLWDSALHRLRPQHPLVREYLMLDWDHASERWVEHAQSSCLLIRRLAYTGIGGMDPKLFLFYNDTDFCYRMATEGFRIRFLADVEILHHGGASVATYEGADSQVYGDRYRYFRKWFGWKGGLAIRAALWSRVGYETLVELAHGDLRFAARKIRRGLKLNRALVASL